MGICSKVWWPDAETDVNWLQIREEALGAGILISGSRNSTSVPLLRLELYHGK